MTDVTQMLLRKPSDVSAAQRVSLPVWRLDAGLLVIAIGVAASLLFQAGLEVGVTVGAIVAVLHEERRGRHISVAISGAFAGLFGGALIAAFFHPLFVAAVNRLL